MRANARLPEKRAVNIISSMRPSVPPSKPAAAAGMRCDAGTARRQPRQASSAAQPDSAAREESASAARGEKRRQATRAQRMRTGAAAGSTEKAHRANKNRKSSHRSAGFSTDSFFETDL